MSPSNRPSKASASGNRPSGEGSRRQSGGRPQRPAGRSGPGGGNAAAGRGRAAAGKPARPGRSREQHASQVPAARGMLPKVAAVPDDLPGSIRLQKFLAAAGVDSRRNCESYIREGRVTVDNEVVIDPAAGVFPETQDIRLDGERLKMPRFKYFLINKPKGVLCTNSDPQGRVKAIDLVPSHGKRLFTVGRLDESTEGLLLITNDGDLAQRLAHPRFEVVRRYRCHVAGMPNDEVLRQLREGMYFSDGFFRFRGIRLVKRQGRSTILELELREGKNREIRRLLAKVGHKVIALERIAFGPLRLGSLHPGKHRELGTREVLELRRALEELERNGGDPVSERRPIPRSARRKDEQKAAGSAEGRPDTPKPPTRPDRDRGTDRNPSRRRLSGPSKSAPSKSGVSKAGVSKAGPTKSKAAKSRPGKAAAKRRPEINKGRDRRRS